MQITGQWSANNASIPIMRTFHYHCSHLAMYRHIHRNTKSTPSFTVKKIRDPAWNYQLQAAEPQQEVLHNPEFHADGEKKFLMLWEAAGCSKQLWDGDQTQTAQSTLLSPRRTRLQHRRWSAWLFGQTRWIKARLVKAACILKMWQRQKERR